MQSYRVKTWRCDHPRTRENTASGAVPYCMACRRALHAAKSEEVRERNAKIFEAVKSGMRRREVSGLFGVSLQTIANIMCKASPPKPCDPLFFQRALPVAARAVYITQDELLGPSRDRDPLHARYALMHALRRRGVSTPRIGRLLGGRDHSTVINGLQRAAQLAAHDYEFAQILARVDAA